MKFFCVVAALLCLFKGLHGLIASKVKCTETSMVFTGSPKDFPRYTGSSLSLGSCPLSEDFSVVADFVLCGLSRSMDGETITYLGDLISAPEAGVITRRKPINFVLACTYNRKSSRTATSLIKPKLGSIEGDVTQSGSTVDLFLNLVDDSGNVISSGDSVEVQVGASVYAQVGGDNLETLGLRGYARNCFVTPNADPTNRIRYDLLKNGCSMDETFLKEESGDGETMLFESFAFTSDTLSSLFLHCDLVACEADEGCGLCSPTRKRRSASHPFLEKRVSVEFNVIM